MTFYKAPWLGRQSQRGHLLGAELFYLESRPPMFVHKWGYPGHMDPAYFMENPI